MGQKGGVIMGVLRLRDQKISRLFFKELTKEQREKVYNIKNGPNAGKSMAMFKDKTHKVSLQLEDGDWFEVGHTIIHDDKPVQWRKELDGEWTTINEGALVCFKANENSWRDKETDELIKGNSKMVGDSFDMIENGPGNANPFIFNPSGPVQSNKTTDSGGQKKWAKKDYSGVSTGHSINCGLIATKYKLDVTKILKASKNAHDITIKLQEEYKAEHPELSDYDRNAAVGHSILNAFRIGGKASKIEENARVILKDIVPEIMAYVKGEKTEDKTIPDDTVKRVLDNLPDDDIDLDQLPF